MQRGLLKITFLFLVLIFTFTQTGKGIPPDYYIQGYLFTLGDEHYFVRDIGRMDVELDLNTTLMYLDQPWIDGEHSIIDRIIYTERELKEHTSLDVISHNFIKPAEAWIAEMKGIAEAYRTEEVNNYEKEYEDFDLQTCMNDCVSGEITPGALAERTREEACQEHCTEWPGLHYNRYKPLAEGTLEPTVVYNSGGHAVGVKVDIVKDDRTYRTYNVDINALRVGLIEHTYDREYFNKEKAKQILEKYLARKGISGEIIGNEYVVYSYGEGEYNALRTIFIIVLLSVILIVVFVLIWKNFIKHSDKF